MERQHRTAAALLSHPERLTSPLLRNHKGDEFRPVPWDEALDRIAVEIASCQEKYGRESVGVFGGGGLTNEKAYLLGKFARVALRTPHIDYNGRFCMSAAATAAQRAFGIDRGLPFPLADIANTEAILLVGSNTLFEGGHPMRMGADCFLDGSEFDPERVEEYLAEFQTPALETAEMAPRVAI